VKQNLQRKKDTAKAVEMQVVMPLELGIVIAAEESVRLLIEITERLDYRELYAAYVRPTRADEATPKQMFQIVILGFMTRAYATRQLEAACRHDIRFMYLLKGKRVPDHSRFASFIKERLNGQVGEGLFYQLVKELEARGEVAFEHLFVDGTKLEANASRYSFVWAKSVSKHEARLEGKLSELLSRIKTEYGLTSAMTTPEECQEALLQEKEGRRIQFVHGRGKRKTQLQRDMELLQAYLSRKAKYTDYNATFKGSNSFSKTDRDATFMRMKEDHMRNGQLKPGYNLQLAVEGEYIVGVDIRNDRSDEGTLLALLDRMHAGYGKQHEKVIADAGYESEENYLGIQQRGQIAYIKPQNYEKSKTRKYRTNAYLRENMPYHEQTDTYTCPAGKQFKPLYETKRRSKPDMRRRFPFMNALPVKGVHKRTSAPAPKAIAVCKSPSNLLPCAKRPWRGLPAPKARCFGLTAPFSPKAHSAFSNKTTGFVASYVAVR
jgi:transposase